MKVISLLQPWATLVVIGAKKIETRSWNTKYRGNLIHASKGKKKDGHDLWHQENCWERFAQVAGMHFAQLPFGAIIGKVMINATAPTLDFMMMKHSGIPIAEGDRDWNREIAFGDYSPGRYGWLLSDPVQFDVPVPAKGSLGLWNFDLPAPTTSVINRRFERLFLPNTK